MAYVLLEPGKGVKGIIVFKHLEIKFLLAMPEELIDFIKNKYFIGMYVGFYTSMTEDPKYVDFYLAADNVLRGNDLELPRCALNGFNFIDDNFARHGGSQHQKLYDFLYIGNSQVRKNLLKLVEALHGLSEQGVQFSCAIINRVGYSLESRLYVAKVRRALGRIPKSSRERILYIESNITSDPLPKRFVSDIMKASRALVCTSTAEGAARVVAEAALNDLVIISYAGMKGGTNNFLDDTSDILYGTDVSLCDALASFVGNKSAYDGYVAKNKLYYRQSYSKQKLKAFLCKYLGYDQHYLSARIDHQDLYNAFSGHKNLIDSELSNPRSDEVLGVVKMLRFLVSKAGHDANRYPMFRFRFIDAVYDLKSRVGSAKNVLKPYLIK